MLRNKRGHDSERPAHRDEEWPPLAATGESPRTETKTQHSNQSINKKKSLKKKIDFIFHSGRTWGLGSPPRTALLRSGGGGWEERSVYSASGHLAGFCIPREAVSWYRIDYSNQGTSVLKLLNRNRVEQCNSVAERNQVAGAFPRGVQINERLACSKGNHRDLTL